MICPRAESFGETNKNFLKVRLAIWYILML